MTDKDWFPELLNILWLSQLLLKKWQNAEPAKSFPEKKIVKFNSIYELSIYENFKCYMNLLLEKYCIQQPVCFRFNFTGVLLEIQVYHYLFKNRPKVMFKSHFKFLSISENLSFNSQFPFPFSVSFLRIKKNGHSRGTRE